MSIATATPATTEDIESEAIQLSDLGLNDLDYEGAVILNSLQTVIRAKLLNDPIPMAASNVVKNEQAHAAFSHFIRKVARYEAPAQRAEVERLLVFCYQVP